VAQRFTAAIQAQIKMSAGFSRRVPSEGRVRSLKVCAEGMHRNPVKRGLLLEPEQWQWSSYRSYAYQEEGRVKINQWPKAVMKVRTVA
jgi:hypothetical protein